MAQHAEILDSFKEILDEFDYSNEEHVTQVRSFSLFAFSIYSDGNDSPTWLKDQ